MLILSALYRLVIGPLEFFFDVLYSLSFRFLGNQGLAIVVLSLCMNFLVLPLYRRADALQAQEGERERSLQPWVKHIKKTFSGNERFMMLQTYYRQNDYKPAYALKGSLSLLLEIPFFIAAYRFLSGLTLLNEVSFGPIRDLGAPDGMLVLGGVAVNVLPVLMTAINLVSGYLYTRGMSAKSKIQLYGMALIFLVLLYQSPAGLVFYWTLNNLFSLGKNIFYKLKRPGLVLCCLSSVLGLAGLAAVLIRPLSSAPHQAWALALLPLLQLPLLIYWLLRRRGNREIPAVSREEQLLFRVGCVFLTLLTGALIPSAVIRSSPEEFVNIFAFRTPLLYVLQALLLAAGFFLVWLGVFYALSGPGGKRIMSLAVWILSGWALIDYMGFGTNLGTLSPMLQFSEPLAFTGAEKLLNLAVLAAAAGLLYLIWRKRPAWARYALTAAALALLCMSAVNLVQIHGAARDLQQRIQGSTAEEENDVLQQEPSIPLSREGKNVVVIMLDRAIGAYLPYLMQEKPQLQEQFSGFVFYPNTISFGGCTNLGAPGIYGGYEYTPVEMNRRSDETLAAKNDEALKVMPVLFDENGYTVTVCDPTYAGYQWVPDLSIYDDYPEIRTFITKGRFVEDPENAALRTQQTLERNFFCYGLLKISPLVVQPVLYSDGLYSESNALIWKPVQNRVGVSKAFGLDSSFMAAYTVLQALPEITQVQADTPGTFLMMSNDTTHEPTMLQEPDYIPTDLVDNTDYDAAHMERPSWDGQILTLGMEPQAIHYQINMAALLQLGQWFDYLRENGVYDNTRIILVADHGQALFGQFDDMVFYDGELDVMAYNPLLLVKDFDSTGPVRTDNSFMTNADVPTLALAGLIENPVNPFTHKPISDAAKHAGEVYISTSKEWDIGANRGNVFLPAPWLAVHDDIFLQENWRLDAAVPEQ